MDICEIEAWLREERPEKVSELLRRADETRKRYVGDAVHLRGLIELSNICRRDCLYCGIRKSRTEMVRYRMTREETLEAARTASEFGYGTVVLQAGEDYGLSAETAADLVRSIKRKYSLAVTLSLGERPESDWRLWREAGADRYLIRFETSNRTLFEAIHPRAGAADHSGFEGRLNSLRVLRRLGYEIGSGVMIGIPGQTYTDLARDLALFRELDLDMIGTGPFLAHPATPLGTAAASMADGAHLNERRWKEISEKTGFTIPIPKDQVPSSNLMGFKVIALSRLLCPDANIPSTTAIATNDAVHGRITGLQSGANVIMPNLTPTKYRMLYEIYPNKAATAESPLTTHQTALEQIMQAGRIPGTGAGSRQNHN